MTMTPEPAVTASSGDDAPLDARITFPDVEPLSEIVDTWLQRNLGWLYGQLDEASGSASPTEPDPS